MSSQSKKNTFYGAAALLTVTTIVVKIIGAIYKIPLTALLPDEAYGDFGAAYNIYSFFLTISTAGLPVALSKTVSECNALGRENQKERVLPDGLLRLFCHGVFSFICMSVFSQSWPPTSCKMRRPSMPYWRWLRRCCAPASVRPSGDTPRAT